MGILDDKDKRIAELEECLLRFLNWQTDEEGKKSLVDDDELWDYANKLMEYEVTG